MKFHPIFSAIPLLLLGALSLNADTIKISGNSEISTIAFASDKIQKAYKQSPIKTDKEIIVHFSIDTSLGAEAYQLKKIDASTINIVGGNETGALYGGYELAEQIKLHGVHNVTEKSEQPRFPFRAVKFNLPWSAYRNHHVVHQHTDTVKDLKYWEGFMDMMVENRLNVLTLWNLHPFPYMFKPTNFPEACRFSDAEMEEWKTYWKALFKMAKERKIETYMAFWNIFVSPEFAEHHNLAEYHKHLQFFGNGEDNELINRYNKECVTQLINEYEDLTGIGISLGERMYHQSAEEREQWILDVIVEGMKAADRKIKFIHRAPFTKHAKITRKGIESIDCVIPPIWVEYKFNASHGHSARELFVTHGAGVNTAYWEPEPEKYKMTWMMRNESFVALRWGQSDFIRDHISTNGQSYVGGYFIGSETLIPAKDYIQKRPDKRINWKYEYERHWLFYKLWGKLLYNPDTPDQQFIDELAYRYGKKHAESLFQAINLAGNVNLRVASFFIGNNDPSLTTEHFLSRDAMRQKGVPKREHQMPFIHLNAFITRPVLDQSYINIKNYVSRITNGPPLPETITTPLELADICEKEALLTLKIISGIQAKPGPIDYELADIKAWSFLSLYFAEKIRGGVALQLYRTTKDKDKQQEAVKHLTQALEHWKAIAEITDEVMVPILSAKLLHIQDPAIKLSWTGLIKYVEHDIEIARNNIIYGE